MDSFCCNEDMHLLTILATTSPEHADHGKYGGAYVSCWIDRDNLALAEEVARSLISECGWNVIRVEETSEIDDSTYEGERECRQYYEQALIDKEVLVFHTFPIDSSN
jgi:hypothetical protein